MPIQVIIKKLYCNKTTVKLIKRTKVSTKMGFYNNVVTTINHRKAVLINRTTLLGLLSNRTAGTENRCSGTVTSTGL